MKNRSLVLNAILLTFFAGLLTSPNAQQTPINAEKSDHQRRQLAVSLLRTINTAEAVDQSKYGSYSSWPILLEHYSEYFEQFLEMNRQQLPNAHFADLPEILPDWDLRMNLHADAQGYDIVLQDMTDKKCGYAVVSNETVIIRQSKTIDCEI